MTKHHLEIVLGLVRRANAQGRLYPRPGPGLEQRALNFLVREGVVIAVLGSPTSPAGYAAVRSPASERPPALPVRRALA